MKLQAVIFDMDGTIVDSEGAWGYAFVTILGKIGVQAKDDHPQTSGISMEENWKTLLERENIKTEKTVSELVDLTLNEYLNQLDKIILRDGTKEIFDRLVSQGIRIALGTSTDRDITSKILNKLGIQDNFEIIICGDDVEKRKPAPDIFLKVLDKLNLKSDDCMVIEDTPSGIKAANSAGIKVVVMNWENNFSDDPKGADFVANSFKEVEEIIFK